MMLDERERRRDLAVLGEKGLERGERLGERNRRWMKGGEEFFEED